MNILSESEALEKDDAELKEISDLFVEKLSVGEDVAILLSQEGFSTIEQVAYVPISELEKIEGFDDKLVNELRERAEDQLLIEAISTEENLDEHGPEDDLLELKSINEELAYSLARLGVNTREKLAEQSIDELIDIDGLDGTLVPNTGTPVPGGLTYWQTVEVIETLFSASSADVIGADVVEIVPGIESNLTQFTAAMLVTKIIAAHIASS